MWTCISTSCDASSVVHSVGELLTGTSNLNKLQFTWSGAGTLSPFSAKEKAQEAGAALSALLLNRLGNAYRGRIHFVGHSLGTVVNSYAAAQFLASAPGVRTAQFTALDRPDSGLDVGSEFFPQVLGPAMRANLTFKLDNYWSRTGSGVGRATQGIAGALVYNHRRPRPTNAACEGCSASYDDSLHEPNDVGGRYFEAEFPDNDHSGVQQWFRQTMGPNSIDPGTCEGSNASQWDKPFFFHGSLNPCHNGWYWSLFGPASTAFPSTPEPDTPAVVEQPIAGTVGSAGSTPDFASNDLSLEADAATTVSQTEIVLPSGTTSIRFRLTRSGSEGAFVVVLLDSKPLWSGSAASLTIGVPIEIGPVLHLRGDR